MATQSWAAWLLDSYASSVSHLASDNPERKDEDSTPAPTSSISSPSSQPPSATSVGSSSSQVSGYGPYVRTGRGGAGNFHWESSQQDSNDVEAQKPGSLAERRKAASKLERLETGEAMGRRVASTPYMHVGRGGAGNYTQSNEIQSAKSPRSASATYAPSTATPTVGRGGAGNMMAAMDAKSKLEQEKAERARQQADKQREQIEQQVAGMLQPPPGAVIATANRRSSMILEDV